MSLSYIFYRELASQINCTRKVHKSILKVNEHFSIINCLIKLQVGFQVTGGSDGFWVQKRVKQSSFAVDQLAGLHFDKFYTFSAWIPN